MSYGSGRRLLAEVGSDAAMCPTAPDTASLLGGLQAAMHPVVSCESRASSIKKSLASLPVQLGTHVLNSHMHVFMALDVKATMGLQDVRTGNTVNTYKACRQAATM
jgi:hypothetical protein